MHLQGNVTVERAALAVHLVHEARRLFPAIQFHFNTAIQVLDCYLSTACEAVCDDYEQMTSCTSENLPAVCRTPAAGLAVQGHGGDADYCPTAVQDFDLQNRSVTLQAQNSSSGGPQKLSYDLLVGADGVGSQVWPPPAALPAKQYVASPLAKHGVRPSTLRVQHHMVRASDLSVAGPLLCRFGRRWRKQSPISAPAARSATPSTSSRAICRRCPASTPKVRCMQGAADTQQGTCPGAQSCGEALQLQWP